MEKPTFFARRALLILVVVFFFVPFALRGARMALLGMKNDVKDWLPKDFEETRDLDEFRRYFLSEQFVLVSWDGCSGDETDERFRLFLAKLNPELPPSVLAAEAKAAEEKAAAAGEGAAGPEAEPQRSNPTVALHRDENFIGDKLGLYYGGDWYENWGARGEKWLKGLRLAKEGSNEECWYFLTPDGDLFRWDEVDAPPAALARAVYRRFVDKRTEGTLVHSFGLKDGAWYHADPRRLRAQLFKTVTTGPAVLESLTREGGELSGSEELAAEAKRRLSGVLFGEGGKTTCMMLTLTDAARRNLHLVCGRGLLGKPRGRLFEIAHESNISESELRLGGPPVDNVAIDEEGSVTLVRLVSWSAVLGIGLSLICFRSISLTIMIFFVGGISAVMSLAAVWWLGSTADAITLSMPSMVYVLGLSGAAHIINYYRDAVDHHGLAGAPERAIAQGWKPAFLCEVTTAIGLITLVTSELVPIRKFGLFSGLAVMGMFLVMMTYLPAALQIWPQPPRKKRASSEPSWLAGALDSFWPKFSGWIVNHHALVAVGCTLVIAAFGYGVVYMRTSVNLLKMFHSEAKIIRDYQWLEANLGPLVPMEIVVRVPAASQRPSIARRRELEDELAQAETPAARKTEIERQLRETPFQLSFLERMELATRVQRQIEAEFGPSGRGIVGRSVCASTFVRPLPEPSGSASAQTTRATMSSLLEKHKAEFLHSDYLRVKQEDQTEMWRVSLRVGATNGVDYGAFVSDLQQTVEPIVAAEQQRSAILRQLHESLQRRGDADPALAGSTVVLVGVPEAALARRQAGAAPPAPTAVDQQKIFARTLYELLVNSRMRLTTLAAGKSLPADLNETLAASDCVVVVGDMPGLDLARLRGSAPLVIDARVQPLVPGQRTAWQRDPASVAAVYTGVVPIVYKAQRLLLDSLIQSTFWSIITITPLLMWIARSFSGGAVSMLPNVLPIVMVFGGMGWLGIDVDVGSMMTASIALGVAVDDTIHFLNWFRVELDRLGDRKQAILATYKHCATPTLQAAVISGLGLSIFALSTFTPTQRFGCLMLVILWAGAIAELIYFPAILAGPLGRVFQPRKQPATEPQPAAEDKSQPQFQVVHHDDEPEESLAAHSGNGHPPPPHTGKAPHRQIRADAAHRR
ncbi:MAG TPA: MMPL family transporter [Pirellulaceae bacterium]|nr:MMPL family transporter [Pirellulaceae bacterium]